jgi:hypothetical protein
MKQHRADGVSLVFGLIFLIIAAWWAIGSLVDIDLNIPNFGWVVAFGLIAIGLVGVVGSLRSNGNGNASTGAGGDAAPVTAELTDPAGPVAQEDDTAVDGLPPVSDKTD